MRPSPPTFAQVNYRWIKEFKVLKEMFKTCVRGLADHYLEWEGHEERLAKLAA